MESVFSYPFAAVVGQDRAKRAILIAVVNPRAGGLLLGGPKGTAKSTLIRGLGGMLGGRKRVDLPLNATEDMVFGSLDIEYAIEQGKRRFSPGILARADENVLYIDEVNLLQRDLLNTILDSNAAGFHLVEREGISARHSVHSTIIGTMNPEEGLLPPQLLDRFGMYAETESDLDATRRAEIVRSLLEFERNRQSFLARSWKEIEGLGKRIAKAREIVAQSVLSDAMLELAAQMCAQAYSAGHRAELYLLEAAKAIAALEGRAYVLPKDMEEAAQFVLPHRMRKPPSEKPPSKEPQPPEENPNEKNDSDEQPNMPPDAPLLDEEDADDERDEQREPSEQKEDSPVPKEQTAEIDKSFTLPKMMVDLGKDRNVRRGSGKRSATRTDIKQGRYVRAAISKEKVSDLAFDATIRVAAPYQRLRESNGCAIHIRKEDLRQKIREKRIGSTFLFLVDASGSMGARERMKAVKGAIFSMLQEAYQKRDKVGMIAFRRNSAEVLLPITRSVDLAEKCLRELPTGGKTPLAEGLESALNILSRMNKRDKEQEPILVLVTDGRANAAGDSGEDPVERALALAWKIGEANITSVVIDTESDFIRLGVAKSVAGKMRASYYSLKALSKEQVLRIVRNLDTVR